MLEVMRFYILRPGWRVRLARNSAATSIWLLWVWGAGFGIAAITSLVLSSNFESTLICLGLMAALFAVSFLLLPAARKIYEIDKLIHREHGPS